MGDGPERTALRCRVARRIETIVPVLRATGRWIERVGSGSGGDRPGVGGWADVCGCNTLARVPEPFDLDLLDDEDPFEIDDQAAHLFKHPRLGVEDIYEVWQSDPLFYPAKPPAHWLMVAEVAGDVLVVPLAPPDSDDPTKCRPIGCYVAATHLVTRYREDR